MSLQTYRAFYHFSHTVERKLPIFPRLSLHTFPCSTMVSSTGPTTWSSVVLSRGHRGSLIWPPPLLLFSPSCPQGAFSHIFFPYSSLHAAFRPSYMCFPRGTTSLAAGLSCVLQGVCRGAGWKWPCLAWGSPGLFPQKPPLAPQHLPTDTQYKLATIMLKQLGHTQKKIQVKRLPFKASVSESC